MDVSWWWLLAVLVQATWGSQDVDVTQGSRDVVIILNTLRPITHISDTFLGISTSLRQLLKVDEYSVAAVNMLRALSPGYLRVGGPETDSLTFTNASSSSTLTGSQWDKINQLAKETGLHLIFSLSPKSNGQGQLLQDSEDKGYDITWQLGYYKSNDNRTTEESAKELGLEVSKLRRLIDSFPRYQNTATLSPDLELCEDTTCVEAHKTFLRQASNAFDTIVWQLKQQANLDGIKKMFEKLNKISQEVDISSLNRETVLRKTKYSMRNNIWVSEDGGAHSRGGMTEVMSCAMSLGLASCSGYHTFLLHLDHLSKPSPSYWTALLWQALVGRAVLGSRMWPMDAAEVFAACTNPQPREGEWQYTAGAVTVWGINAAEESTRVSLRTGVRLDEAHLYVLTGDTGDVLLNGRPLRLVHGVVPRLPPRIRTMGRSMSVTLPPQSVFFIVLPNAQAPACFSSTSRKLPEPLKKEDMTPMVMNIPIFSPKIPFRKLQVQPGNMLFEKGGIFMDAIANKDRVQNVNQPEVTKHTEMGVNLIEDGEKINIGAELNQNKKLPNKIGDSSKVNQMDGSDNVDLSTNNKNKYWKLHSENTSDYLTGNKEVISTNFSRIGNNNQTKNVSQTPGIEVPRVKRSEEYDYYDQIRDTDTETSPLYRRVNFLREILNKMKQQTQYENEEHKKYFRDSTGTGETLHSNDKSNEISRKIYGKYSSYPVDIPPKSTNHMEKMSSFKDKVSTAEQNKQAENINYLPGEFYEILGGLKIDSNILLKDKEEATEEINSGKKLSETQMCNNSESKLKVTKKPENDPQEDRRLVEHATESSKQYYLRTNYTTENKLKSSKAERKIINNKGGKLLARSSLEDLSGSNDKTEAYPEKLFQTPKMKNKNGNSIQVHLDTIRSKRDINTLDENSFDKSLMQQSREDNQNISDYSEEVELRRFLEELTNEGEQLLQTIDDEYENNVGNFSDSTGTSKLLTTESVPTLFKDKFVLGKRESYAMNITEEPDFYLKNNILIDSKAKPKLKYQSSKEKNIGDLLFEKFNYSRQNNNLTRNVQQNTTSGIALGPIVLIDEHSKPLELTTSGELVILKANDSFGITEAIKNSDSYTETLIPQNEKTTKPDINPVSYSKLEYSSNLPEKHTESTNIAFDTVLNKNYKTGEETTNFSSGTESTSIIISANTTDKHKIQSKGDPSLGITFPEPVIDVTAPIKNPLKSLEEIKKSVKNDSKINNLDSIQEEVKPFSRDVTTDIPEILGTTTEYAPFKKRKVHSESRLENIILPPPFKPLSTLRPLLIPSLLNEKRNSSLPKKIEVINNRITEFNNKQQLSVPALEKGVLLNTNLSERYQKRLEAIKQRLQIARERFLNFTSPVKSQIKLYSTTSKPPIESMVKNPSLENIQRLKRQLYEYDEKDRGASEEDNLSLKGNVENEESSKEQYFTNVVTPYYFSAIKKWVIPLSNNTENIFYNSKLFPVNLYAIVSDKWVQDNVKQVVNLGGKRERRALKYPCIKDRFNDFESDETSKAPQTSNFGIGKSSSLKSMKAQFDSHPGKTTSGTMIPHIYNTRSKRATDQDIAKNEMEIKALLTNEIVKDKPINEVADQENVFSSMLHKTLTKTMTNKTGFERMFELAKQYNETNPSSLEIFSTKNKRFKKNKVPVKNHDNTKKAQSSIETTDGIDISDHFTATQMAVTESIPRDTRLDETAVVINSSFIDKPSINEKKSDETFNKDHNNTMEDIWSDFVNNIQGFFEAITTEIKKGIL